MKKGMKISFKQHKSMKTLFALIILISGFTVSGQQLTLSDAVQLALERNYDIVIERESIKVAQNNNNWGEAGRYPKLDLNVGFNNSLSNNIKTATPFQIQDLVINSTLQPGIALNWTIFNGMKIIMSKRRLEGLQAETEGNASVVISNTIQSVILGYYTALLEQTRVEQFKKQMNLSRDKYEYLQIKKDLGASVTSDLLLEESNYLTDSTNFINQQLRYRNAIRNLNTLLVEDDLEREYEFENPGLEFGDLDKEQLFEQLNAENVDLRKQYISQAILEYNTRINKADRYPTLSLGMGYNYTQGRIDLSNANFPSENGPVPGPADPLTTATGSTYANFTISFNLFNGGRITRAIQNAVIQEDIGNARLDQLKNNLSRDLLQAYDAYQVRRQLYGINQRKRETDEKNLEISTEKYRNGTINSFDYRIVQNNALVSSIQELQSIYDLIDSKVTVMRLTGGIVREYLK